MFFLGSSSFRRKSLSLTVVLPLIVGQLLRMLAWRRISAFGIPWGPTASAVLLMIIYSAFCDTFAGDVNVDQKSLLSILGIVRPSLYIYY